MDIIQEKILLIQLEALKARFPYLVELYGLRTEIFIPIANDSHYNNSTKFFYNENPNFVKKTILFDDFQRVLHGDISNDNFNPQNSELITLASERIETNCLIKRYKGTSSYTEFRINKHWVINGINGAIFIRHELVPYS